MQYLHTNNASSNLRDPITTVGQSIITVTSGHGTLFPLPGVNQGFFVTVEDRRSGRLEIMLCTSRVGDSLTVTRGQQGTVPQTFVAGINVSNRVTAQILNEFAAMTVGVLDPAQIPAITTDMITSLNAVKVTGPGLLNLAVIPQIPGTKLISLDAAKITTGTLDPARIPVILTTSLPTIPSAKITAVDAAAITTGFLPPARIDIDAITSGKIASLSATKLTGTIDEARFPTSFQISGSMHSGSLTVDGNVNIGGAITGVDSIDSSGTVFGHLQHRNNGGYLYVGSYDTAVYGTGYGRLWFNRNIEEFTFAGAASGLATVRAIFSGNGDGITGVCKSDNGVIEAPRWLLGPGGGHSAGIVYNASDLATPHFVCDTTTNNMSMTFTNGTSGNTWRAMQAGSAVSGKRALGLFVRVS